MAVNNTRSMNEDLQAGIHDGCCKNLSPDRGGSVELHDLYERYATLQQQYGITDSERGLLGKISSGSGTYGY
jgi:hypothetical protein